MTRTERVNIIKQWYERGAGKLMVEKHLPKHATAITQHYETPQILNDERISGTYCFEFVQGTTRHIAYVASPAISTGVCWNTSTTWLTVLPIGVYLQKQF